MVNKNDCSISSCSSNHCPVTFSSSVTKPVNTAFNVELQATDEDNNSLVYSVYQLPAHGTVSITDSIAHYTPAAGYYGNDIFLFNVTDGKCNVQDTVYITIVVCPQQQGYWKNNSAAWPPSATPMLLGSVSYTKSQLITILKTPVGSGNKADASLILAYQLIAVKLSIANGTPVPQSIADAIAAANVLIGSNKIPMNIRTNSTVGKQMVKLADLFSNYLAGTMTPGCGAAAARTAFNDNVAPVIPSLISLQQNYPNPFSKTTVIRYALPEVSHVTLNVYNFTGQKVATLVDGMQKAGYSSVVFNAGALPAGVYFCRMQSGDFTATIKMVQVK